MKIRIEKGTAYGQIAAPPSKSYGHRMLICAALASGRSTIGHISSSEDMLATIDCIRALGGEAELSGDCCRVSGIARTSGDLPEYKCRESGSTLRFFIPLALALTGGGVFRGSRRLIERGIDVYEEIFAPRGVTFDYNDDAITVRGSLQPGNYRVRGDVSSQFITGLLFALPLLEGDSSLEIVPPVESRPYIDITADAMKQFGVMIEEPEQNRFVIRGGQKYKPADITVEGDWSNAAFLYAISMLASPEGIAITGLNDDSIQGDRVCVECFDRLARGAGDDAIEISGCPDLGPVLFAFAAAAGGGKFTGIRRLRIKESDRAAAMAQELEKFDIRTIVSENDMEILPGRFSPPDEPVYGHNDHRIVMALAVLLILTGGEIEGAEAVSKSYPEFFDDLRSIGVAWTVLEK